MTKKMPQNQAEQHSTPLHEFWNHLDFTATQKQVNALMTAVIQENMINENKMCFIKEQLNDKRYQINPKKIASKLIEGVYGTDTTPSELEVEME